MNVSGVTTLCTMAAAAAAGAAPAPAAPETPWRHDAYVWQRRWHESVEATVLARGTNFIRLVALVAEVSWKQGQPSVVQVPIAHRTLAQAGGQAGLALRIGPFSGPFAATDARTVWLADLAAGLLAEARSNALPLAELQLDFDCAESKLAGYQIWVEAIRRRVAPLPVIFTALPAWLKHAEFASLARSADGFVLQVHSLDPPRNEDASFTLCNPAAARRAVAEAGRLGVPFRVALPTYGYLVAFDRDGKFIGLSAEGPARSWPEGARLREVHSDPQVLAGLVAGWATNRPAALRGVIWYRLPMPGDQLNWRWPTLAAVMQGRAPAAALRAVTQRPSRGLVEIELRNDGTSDASGPVQVALRWNGARVVACDGLAGFDVDDGAGQELRFRSPPARLPAGDVRRIGWARFDRDTEVEVAVETH